MIASVDEFVLYDDVQFTKNDWRNRNKIKTPKGVEWLSVPVGQNIDRKIMDVLITDTVWQHKHWKTLIGNYRRAACFDEVAGIFEPLYLKHSYRSLSELNRTFIEAVCAHLGIKTKISNSFDFKLTDGRVERLVDVCGQTGANVYVSGPAAQSYLDESLFRSNGIDIEWFDYSGYPEYPQLWGAFEHGVSMLDLLFNCGRGAGQYMKYVKGAH